MAVLQTAVLLVLLFKALDKNGINFWSSSLLLLAVHMIK